MDFPITFKPAADLVPYERNARTHSKEQIAQIKELIRLVGFTNPILEDAQGIIAGHGRQMAALEMYAAGEVIHGPGKRFELPAGMVPVIDASGMSDAERRAYILADNQVALNAGWDDRLVGLELQTLKGLGFDLTTIGFDDRSLVSFMATTKPEADPEETPEPPAIPTSKPGDLWLLGDHRIICGDSTNAQDVARVRDGSPDMLVSDPPYGIGFEYGAHDDTDSKANADLVRKVFELAPKAKAWTPGLMNLARDISRFGEAKVICWHKGFAAAGNGMGGASTWEPVLVVEPLMKKLDNDYIRLNTDRIEIGGKALNSLHPCPKPVELYKEIISAFVPVGAFVFEPFSGSGTTLIAGEITGRGVRAIEIDPAYVDLAVVRWQTFTGKSATLAGDGRTFADIAEQRAKG